MGKGAAIWQPQDGSSYHSPQNLGGERQKASEACGDPSSSWSGDLVLSHFPAPYLPHIDPENHSSQGWQGRGERNNLLQEGVS